MSVNESKALKTIIKAYKVRIFPCESQIEQIEKTFGASRFIYNFFLGQNKERLELDEYTLGYKRESEVLTFMKKLEEYKWLSVADKFSLQNAIKDQDRAFSNFFSKRAKFPKFHSKKDNYQSYRTNFTNNNIEILDNKIKLPKLKWIKFAKSQEIKGRILNVTISRSNYKYYASIAVETEIKPKPTSVNKCGIDLGVTSLMVIKNDKGIVEDIKNPKFLEKSLKNLKRKQKQLSRKQHSRKKGDTTPKSKNYIKKQKTVAKIQELVANQRKDMLHKLSTKIINENQVIGIEDLNVSGMLKNHKLARHIAQSGWRMFRTMLEYKAKWHNREIYVHDRWYASSKTCRCGVKNKELTLKDRVWTCKSCGSVNLRDELASENLIPTERGKFKLVESAMSGSLNC
jgi:putative transposase